MIRRRILATLLLASLASPALEAQNDFLPEPVPVPVPAKADAKKPAAAPPRTKETAPPKDLTDARRQAQLRKAPIVALLFGDDDMANAALRAAVAEREPKKALADFVVVEILSSRLPEEAILWQIERTPAVILLRSTGRWVATASDKLTATDLALWLRNNHDAAESATDVTKSTEPDAAELKRLVSTLGSPDPLEREAALRRLTPYPKSAVPAVVTAFVEGPLQARLTALEALHVWRAPLEGLDDPWNAAARTPPRLVVLRKWAEEPTITDIKEATPAELAQIREDFDRLLQADEAAALTARERLARSGPAVRADVLARLKDASSDLARQRLAALRYRLAATPALAQRWPDGFERLASPKQAIRHQAVKDLEQLVTASDEKLLLELFASPDPFVREISLRVLSRASAEALSGAIVKLLYDPDPNVRSAVLKQMLEWPPPEWTGKVVEYLKWEKETDLDVAAVRVLREIGTDQSAEALMAIFDHPAWQVRAEAVEGVIKMRPNHGSLSSTLQEKVDKRLDKLLADPDSFVAGKALGLVGRNSGEHLKPLLAMAEQHPEVAVTAVQGLAEGVIPYTGGGRAEKPKLNMPVLEALRKFIDNPREEVRAATITGILQVTTSAGDKNTEIVNGFEREVAVAVNDPASSVRVAALQGVFYCCRRMRQNTEQPDAWLTAFRRGAGWPKWFAAVKARLGESMKSTDAAERLAAATIAVAFGDEAGSFPVLVRESGANAWSMHQVSEMLEWVPTPARKIALFDLLLPRADDAEKLAALVRNVGNTKAAAAIPRLWKLIDSGRTKELLAAYQGALWNLYQQSDAGADAVNDMFRSLLGARPGTGPKARIERDALPRINKGNDEARLLALSLLAGVDEPKALEKTTALVAAPGVSKELRRDGIRLELNLRPLRESMERAVALLADDDAVVRRIALDWVADDYTLNRDTSSLRGMSAKPDRTSPRSFRYDAPLFPTPPADLKAERLLPFLADADPDARATAAFLLVTIGRPEGWEPLHRLWQEAGPESPYTKHLVTAIAMRNDAEQVPVLQEIYEQLRKDGATYLVQPFYWKIRVMTGPEALKLRKRIRAEIGMEHL